MNRFLMSFQVIIRAKILGAHWTFVRPNVLRHVLSRAREMISEFLDVC